MTRAWFVSDEGDFAVWFLDDEFTGWCVEFYPLWHLIHLYVSENPQRQSKNTTTILTESSKSG